MNQTSQNTGKKKRDRIALILYSIYLLLLGTSLFLVVKLAGIQLFYEPGDKLLKELTPTSTTIHIFPKRGNIYDRKGRLLAISCPTYQIAMDCTVRRLEFEGMPDGDSLERDWRNKARKLAAGLATYFPYKSAALHYRDICNNRVNGKKYMKIGRPVDRNTYLKIKELPLFNEGPNKGGLITKRLDVRKYPYGNLASRTIGFKRHDDSSIGNKYVGLEGKFDYALHGVEGVDYLRKTDYGNIRNTDSLSVEPEDGNDLVTTIDIDYQNIASDALHSQIDKEADLEGACLVLMETNTGAIRAMVNLSRPQTSSGPFTERTNMAVGRRGEPGSVFKTVTLMSVLSDRKIKSLDETIPTNHGIVKDTRNKQDKHIVEYEQRTHKNRISILEGFKMSSNYVFATLAVSNYAKDPMKFIDNIVSYKLADKFDFDIDGLAAPVIPTPKTASYWTNTDLGSIGFGYSTEETPLHILTFYNAIAGKGRMVKPYLVDCISKNGVIVEKRGPGILSSSICSAAVADTIGRALRAVTEEGTAKRLKDAKCKVAGKTGTSFGTFKSGGKVVYSDKDGKKAYQGTFVGYFPAEDPQYSIICVVYSKPTTKSFQGGGIPAGAVKEVVDRIYDIDPYFREKIGKER